VSDQPSDPGVPFDERLKRLYANIGAVASLWSLVERSIDYQCWRLAGVEDDPGACLTSQIQSARAKLIALEALVRLRGGTESLVRKIRRFRDAKCQPAADKRNRLVHNPLYVNNTEDTALVDLLFVSPKDGLVKSINSASPDVVRDVMKEIHAVYEEFRTFWPAFESLYPSSANKPR
jgi:hypothetical protein